MSARRALPFLFALAASCASAVPKDKRDERPWIPLPSVAPNPVAVPDKPTPPPPQWIASSRVPEFAKCAACHNAEQGWHNGLGPNLFGTFGTRAASKPNFYYSEALRDSGLVWDAVTLDQFLEDPRALVPGTKMRFSGLKKPEDRKAVIAFLRLRSASRP